MVELTASGLNDERREYKETTLIERKRRRDEFVVALRIAMKFINSELNISPLTITIKEVKVCSKR